LHANTHKIQITDQIHSQYGTIRVYEFGPENGRKVLLLHGITTPCLSLARLASSLVEKGCRVLLLDLFGRGYSDSPDLPHDSRLYSTEILLAITSSPLPWTPEGFSVIGRSLGGAIAVDFAASFPHMVKSLVLLAPAGLIRPSHFGWVGTFKDSVFISDRLLEWAVARRLRGGPIRPNVANDGDEKKGNLDPEYEAAALVESRPDITTAKIVEWQLGYHEGFVRSFVSSIRHSSIGERRETWRKLGKRADKVLIIGGSRNPVIVAEELREDAIEAIGEEKVVWRVVDGGHDFPITRREEVMEEVCDFWGL
jgi:pimeloyl-ACP methyl ester carboxylesterase